MQNHSFGIPPHAHYPPPPPLPPPEAVPRPPRRRRGKISKYKTGHYGMDPVSYNNAGMSNFGESSGQADIPIEETDSEDDGLGETFERGSRFEIKDLYSVRRKDNPYVFHWVDEKPESLEDAKKKKTTRLRDTFAVNLFHLCNESKGEWFVHELRVNSPDARAALETILEGYPDLTRHDLKSFRPPFLPFVHRWADLLAYLERSEVPERIVSQLTFLQTVLQSLLKDSFDKLEDISKTGHVAFDDLPLIYVPGMTAVENATNTAGVIRSCVDSSNNRSLWEIKVDVVDWDGRNCGLRSQSWSISKYQGMRAISALAVSPIDRIAEEDDLRRRLIERGRKFEKLRGQFFLAYSDEYEERRDERVVVDARAYYKHEKAKFPIFEKLSTIGRLTWEQSMNRVSTAKQLHRSQPPTCWDDGSVKVTQHVDTEPTTEVALSPLTDEQCLLAFPYLWCFNINKKEWEHLKLTNLHEIRFAERAFDNLVLDQGEKDLLLALAERDWSKRGSSSFDDFVGGKGQGMVMLLCGPPGVGKTLTAETVAEHLRRPLYRLGASDLGSHATIVEQCLSKALKLCADFSAVLLLDEADVFMEARSTNNLIRNELVSVFLRLLEYYEGIMILTTNRIRSIDPAFESRIDITLSYNSLSKEDRIKVWRNFLVTLDTADVDISDTDMVKLARWDFNGRQIKSAIKTARILAAKKQEPLKASHLEVVLRLRSASLHVMSGVVESDRS